MSAALAIVALTVLVGLGLLSFKRQREQVASEKQRTRARSNTGDAQHERSMNRRAEVRSGLEHANDREEHRVEEQSSRARR